MGESGSQKQRTEFCYNKNLNNNLTDIEVKQTKLLDKIKSDKRGVQKTIILSQGYQSISAENNVFMSNNIYQLLMMMYTNTLLQSFFDSIIHKLIEIANMQFNYVDWINNENRNVQEMQTLSYYGCHWLINKSFTPFYNSFYNKNSFGYLSCQSIKHNKQNETRKFKLMVNEKGKLNESKFKSFENQKTNLKNILNTKYSVKNENRLFSTKFSNLSTIFVSDKNFFTGSSTPCSINKHEQETSQKYLNKTATKIKNYKTTNGISSIKVSSYQGENIWNSIRKNIKGKNTERTYIECSICHKRIKRLYHFHRHMKIHTGKKDYKCPYCSYSSFRKDNLKSHMKKHKHIINSSI